MAALRSSWRQCRYQSPLRGGWAGTASSMSSTLGGIGRPTDATPGRGRLRGATSAASLLSSTRRRLPRRLMQFARRSSRSPRLIWRAIKSVRFHILTVLDITRCSVLPDLGYEVEQADHTALKLPPHPGVRGAGDVCRSIASAMRSRSQTRLDTGRDEAPDLATRRAERGLLYRRFFHLGLRRRLLAPAARGATSIAQSKVRTVMRVMAFFPSLRVGCLQTKEYRRQ